MSDTNILQFSMRERMFLSTPAFNPQAGTTPGRLYRLCADPIGAVIRTMYPDPGTTGAYASPLALTLSRFRDFRYVGTRVALVPAASNGQIDPAHISTTAGANNYMHPRDVTNCFHWRRWMGGNFRIPTLGVAGGWTEADSYALDAAWLSDDRFNHTLVSDGFEFFSQPYRANVTTSAAGTTSLFGALHAEVFGGAPKVKDQVSEDGKLVYHPIDDMLNQHGNIALAGADVRPDTWVPNPFAGFLYGSMETAGGIGDDRTPFYIKSVNARFPWFADTDRLSVGDAETDDFSLIELYQLVRERFLAPLAIIRLPPAYGSPFYWTLFMRHYFAVRKPFLTNGSWQVGVCDRMDVDDTLLTGGVQVQYLSSAPADERIYQMISPDPYEAADSSGQQDVVCLSDDPYAPRMPVYSYYQPTIVSEPPSSGAATAGVVNNEKTESNEKTEPNAPRTEEQPRFATDADAINYEVTKIDPHIPFKQLVRKDAAGTDTIN